MKFSRFFSIIQETPWYREFLNPIINEISNNSKLLDIGTGTGKLIQILSIEKKIECIGIDTNTEMLSEAQNKLKETNVKLFLIKANTELPFDNNTFDYITICNVLFLLKKDSIDYILNEAQRILKKEGKIIILTPSGNGNFISLTKYFFSIKNLSIYIWFYATRISADSWSKNKYLEQYTIKKKLKYKREIIMNGFAQVEVIH